jgi:teichuronic acid exporter
MNIAERTVSGFIGLGSARLIQQSLAWILSIVIARLLSPSDYGLMALAVFFTNFIAFVSEFGLSSALIQRKDLEDQDVHTVFWVMLGANLAIYAFVWFVSEPIASYYEIPQLATVIRVLALTFVISSIRLIPMCLMTRELQIARCGWAELIGAVVSGLAMVVLAYAGYGIWALVLGSLTNSVITTVMFLWLRPWMPRMQFQFARFSGMLSYGALMNTSKILSYLSGNADNLIAGKVLGGTALGLYNMAFILGTMPTQKVTPIIYRISFPVMARLQDDDQRSRQYFMTSSLYIALFAAPAMIGLMVIADDFVALVLGEKWMAIVLPLRVLCSVGILKGLAVMLNVVLSARARTTILIGYCGLEAVVLLVAFLIGSRFGIAGIAAAWLFAYPCLFLYQLRYALRELHIPLLAYIANLKWIAFGTIALTVTGLAGRMMIESAGLQRLVVATGMGALGYVSVVVVDRQIRGSLLAVVAKGRLLLPRLNRVAAESAR